MSRPATTSRYGWIFWSRRTPRPGKYTGTYTVTSDQGKCHRVDFSDSLELYPANNSFAQNPHSFSVTQEPWRRSRNCCATRSLPSATPASQMPLMKGRGLNATDTGPFSGADVGNCKMSPAPSVSEFKARTAGQQPGVLLYDYSADEIGHCTNLYPTIKQWAYNMHQAGINNLVSISPNPALYSDGSGTGRSAVDIWVFCPLCITTPSRKLTTC